MDHRPIVKGLRAQGHQALADHFISVLEQTPVEAVTNIKSGPRQKVNADLRKKGLEGNGRFRSISHGLSTIHDVMGKHGLELDDVFSADLFRGPKGDRTFHIAFSNPQDSFSPVSIHNSLLKIQWHRHDNGRYEMLAYLS